MKAEDLLADYSELTEWELKVLDDWVAYYTKVRSLMSLNLALAHYLSVMNSSAYLSSARTDLVRGMI